MLLTQIVNNIKAKMLCDIKGCIDGIDAVGVTSNSRSVEPGYIFVAVKGATIDGHRFISDAIKKEASAIVIDSDFTKQESFKIPSIAVQDTREALVVTLNQFLGNPPERIFAVTGTNGKTTITHILWHIFTESGEKTGIIGTLGFAYEDGIHQNLPVTTPGAEMLWKILANMKKRGITNVALEASSHGLDQKRVWGVDFTAAIFSNFSQDHLDYHGDMVNYLRSKCMLFEECSQDCVSVVNLDDPASSKIIEVNHGILLTYAIENESADIVAHPGYMDFSGSRFGLKTPWGNFDIETNLPGRFNVYNVMASTAAAMATGYQPEEVIKALDNFEGIKGRFQLIKMGQPFEVVIDYAHTPDALRNLIDTVREITEENVIVVFGAGGDRDHNKRPIMGGIATELADFAVITSDNPRSEDPERIIDMIESGVTRENYNRNSDRKEAIIEAIIRAKPGDTVLIAGKGHEDYQIFANETIHFDDAETAKEAIMQICK